MYSSFIFHPLAVILLFTNAVLCASLQRVKDFGLNPTKLEMFIYVPDKLAPTPPIILMLHTCMGSAQSYVSFSKGYMKLADQKGFVLIYPQTPNNDRCWDVGTAKSLTHDGGGDTQGLASTVKYTLKKYKGDAKKVFVTGSSSGGMMTNAMVATYPELFNAGASFSGVAAGCFAGDKGFSPMASNGTCAGGKITKSPQEWGNIVKTMYPSYAGPRPRMAIWHGTADNLVTYHNMPEMMKEWSNVLEVKFMKNETNNPQSGYTRMVYGDGTRLVGYSAKGVGHMVPQHPEQVLEFFGI